jgi:hypothetical protein
VGRVLQFPVRPEAEVDERTEVARGASYRCGCGAMVYMPVGVELLRCPLCGAPITGMLQGSLTEDA